MSTSGWSGPLSVLVVDDDPDAAEALVALIGLAGHRVVSACDGRDALRRVRDDDFDLVLLDIGLPDMDGYEVARHLTLRGQRTMSVVALTGYDSDEDLRRADGAGFDDHVVKPCGAERLDRILADAAGRRVVRGRAGTIGPV